MSLPLSSSPSLSTFNASSLLEIQFAKAPSIFLSSQEGSLPLLHGPYCPNQQPSILLTVTEV